MKDLIPLCRAEFTPRAKPKDDLGTRGEFKWIPLRELVIDAEYQRPVGEKGRANIRRIIEGFDWALFSPLVVCPRGPNCYAVIDGQHRAIAALSHGKIKDAPCIIITGDQRLEAKAFSVINGQVTSVLSTQIYYARLVAGEKQAMDVESVCQAAQVRVLKFPRSDYKAGDTLAIGTLETCLKLYGRDTLITALQIITQTSDGNPGYLKAPIIRAACRVLHERKDWRDAGEALFVAIEQTGIRAIYKLAEMARARDHGALKEKIAIEIRAALNKNMRAAA